MTNYDQMHSQHLHVFPIQVAKQKNAILKTNGNLASRDVYDDPVSYGVYRNASFNSRGAQPYALMGLVFTVTIEFSGWKSVEAPMPDIVKYTKKQKEEMIRLALQQFEAQEVGMPQETGEVKSQLMYDYIQ